MHSARTKVIYKDGSIVIHIHDAAGNRTVAGPQRRLARVLQQIDPVEAVIHITGPGPARVGQRLHLAVRGVGQLLRHLLQRRAIGDAGDAVRPEGAAINYSTSS